MKSCEAFQSKNRGTNPGDIRTEPLRAYPIHAVNPSGGGYFLIAVPEAPVATERWVSAACGVRVVEPGGQADEFEPRAGASRRRATNRPRTCWS